MSGESESLRIKLVLSVLSGKPLKLKNIRQEEDEPGLAGKKLWILENTWLTFPTQKFFSFNLT